MTYPSPVQDGRRLGFWLVSPMENYPYIYSPKEFFDAYFMTPPYPSFLEYITGNKENWASPNGMMNPNSRFQQLLTIADGYPNIKIAVMLVSIDMSANTLTSLDSFCNAMKGHRSVASIGVEGEYMNFDAAVKANWTRIRDIINKYGFPFVTYRPDVGGQFMSATEGMYAINHGNFPHGDHSEVCGWFTDAANIGISLGWAQGSEPFPGNFTLANGIYTLDPSNWGWDQEVIDIILGYSTSLPLSTRLYTSLCPGQAPSSFVGVSGKTARELWDNPTLRSWIWNSPKYKGNFIQSNSTTGIDVTATLTAGTKILGTLKGTIYLALAIIATVAGIIYLTGRE